MGISPNLEVWTPLWRDVEVDTTFADEEVSPGLRLKLRRGYASVCAYFSVAADHPLAELFPNRDLPISVHGGFSYDQREGDRQVWGWDHGHLGDKLVLPPEVRKTLAAHGQPEFERYALAHETEWTPAMVWEAAQSAIPEMLHLMAIAEGRITLEPVPAKPEQETL